MITITFIEADGTEHYIAAEENTSLMETALANNIKGIDGACGGVLACATCHCYIHPDWVERVMAEDNEKTDEESDMLDVVFDERTTSRLGCQVKLTPALDGLIVALPQTKTGW